MMPKKTTRPSQLFNRSHRKKLHKLLDDLQESVASVDDLIYLYTNAHIILGTKECKVFQHFFDKIRVVVKHSKIMHERFVGRER